MKKLIQLILKLIIKNPEKFSTETSTTTTTPTPENITIDKRIKKGSLVRTKDNKYGIVNLITAQNTAFVDDGHVWSTTIQILRYCKEIKLEDLTYLKEYN